MDVLLSKVTQQAMNYAIRSGITITTGYAVQQCGRLLKETPRDSKERAQLVHLQLRLDSKVKIISPAIDMIELIAARGNTSLESAVSLTREIRYDIQHLGNELDRAANDEQLLKARSRKAKSREQVDAQLRALVVEIKNLLARIEDAVPLINLAITTSGVNLSTGLSGTISPSRLLQASWFLAGADMSYTQEPGRRVVVGPTYTLSLYMLFAGHAREVNDESLRNTTWKEVIHKARVKLVRLPLDQIYDRPGEMTSHADDTLDDYMRGDMQAEYGYQLLIVEDLDDDRVHTFEDDEPQPGPVDDVAQAGIRDVLPIHEISKIFYADTGKILNIGGDSETNHPVLLLKRDVHAQPPRQMMQSSQLAGYDTDHTVDGSDQYKGNDRLHRESIPCALAEDDTGKWRLPADLDPEWIALEVYQEDPDSDEDEDEDHPSLQDTEPPSQRRQTSLDPNFTGALSKLSLHSDSAAPSPRTSHQLMPASQSLRPETDQPIETTLSLLEMLLKLTALQQFRQQSHLTIGDELLNFFLEDSATAGAGPDRSVRRRMRHDAVRRVGFDPYDESPIKRRGEDYLQHPRGTSSPTLSAHDSRNGNGNPNAPWDEAGLADILPSVERSSYSRETTPLSPSPNTASLQQQSLYSSPSVGSPQTAASTPHKNSLAQRLSQARPASQNSSLATPPSTAKSRQAKLRESEQKGRNSPLGRQVVGENGAER